MPEYICFLEPTRKEMPEDPTAAESQIATAHFEYYQSLQRKGSLILAGRTQEPPHLGIMIFSAPTKDDAISMAAQDPAIKAGIFKCRVQEYKVALKQ